MTCSGLERHSNSDVEKKKNKSYRILDKQFSSYVELLKLFESMNSRVTLKINLAAAPKGIVSGKNNSNQILLNKLTVITSTRWSYTRPNTHKRK